MNFNSLLIYCTVIFIATITPGPSVLLSFSNGIKYGIKNTIFSTLGILSAASLQAVISLAGLSTILISSKNIFYVIKYLGSLYLIYMGLKVILSKRSQFDDEKKKNACINKSTKALFLEGFLVGASNPKAIIFFTALFPQFIPEQGIYLFEYMTLIVLLCLITFSCMTIYSVFGIKLISLFKNSSFSKGFNKLVGAAFIGLGIAMATER